MTNLAPTPKPVPIVNPWARPFWDGAREGRLLIQRCRACGKHVFYPRVACPHCFADALDWVQASVWPLSPGRPSGVLFPNGRRCGWPGFVVVRRAG